MAKRYAPHSFAKLDIDFFGAAGTYVGMQSQDEHDRLRLIGALLLEAGRMMEDTSPEFARRLPDHVAGAAARIAILETIAAELLALAGAGRALLRAMSD